MRLGSRCRHVILVPVVVFLAITSTVFPSAIQAQDSTPGADAITFPAVEPLPPATPREAGPLTVVATTPLLADLARQIGGERVDVASILPPNADAHDFEPRPEDLVAAEGADIVVEHGLHLDDWAADLIANSGSDAAVIVATTGVQTMASDEEGFEDGDPHVWFDPRNVKTMTAFIAAGLTATDPEGAASYDARLIAYHQQLDELDTAILDLIETIPVERRKLVTNHDAFGYYVARYGLTYVGSVIPSLDSRAEPSAKDTAELIERIKAEGVPAIFTEASINPGLEEELAREAGVIVVANLYGDTLGEPGSVADTYLGMMQTNTRLIVEGLR